MNHNTVCTRRFVPKHAMLMFKVVDSAWKQAPRKCANLYTWGSLPVTIQLFNGQVNVRLIMCLVVFDIKVPCSLV